MTVSLKQGPAAGGSTAGTSRSTSSARDRAVVSDRAAAGAGDGAAAGAGAARTAARTLMRYRAAIGSGDTALRRAGAACAGSRAGKRRGAARARDRSAARTGIGIDNCRRRQGSGNRGDGEKLLHGLALLLYRRRSASARPCRDPGRATSAQFQRRETFVGDLSTQRNSL